MEILLDTHIFIWYMEGNQKLSDKHIQLIEDNSSVLYLSYASLWEMSIKRSLGKLKLSASPAELVPAQISILQPNLEALKVLEKLPYHHRDPFDRMIISQAIYHNISVMTKDHHFEAYEVSLV